MELKHLLLALNIDSPLSLPQLYKKFGIKADDDEKPERLKALLGKNPSTLIDSRQVSDLQKELALIKENCLEIITVFDKNYPENLRNIFDPPSVIYVKGTLEKDDSLCSIAIVGSRRASFAGMNFADNLGFSLAAHGATIISGLARGIDSASHLGALRACGRTVAVLGSGFGFVYPAANRKLAQQITSRGAVITEFSYFTKPAPFNFPRRNRIISGLSVGVVVVEAAQRSGSLITADFALEQGREVFAVPGFANAPNSKGTNRLIKQGATLIEDELDVIESLPFDAKNYFNNRSFAGEITCRLDEKSQGVYNYLTEEPICVDTICQTLKLTASETLSVLLDLQLKGLISQLPGKLFCKKQAACSRIRGNDGLYSE